MEFDDLTLLYIHKCLNLVYFKLHPFGALKCLKTLKLSLLYLPNWGITFRHPSGHVISQACLVHLMLISNNSISLYQYFFFSFSSGKISICIRAHPDWLDCWFDGSA